MPCVSMPVRQTSLRRLTVVAVASDPIVPSGNAKTQPRFGFAGRRYGSFGSKTGTET